MHTFIDKNGFSVNMTFERGAFRESPTHVFVICRYMEGWLLTKHRKRGLEFPGGKKEQDETLEEAARREIWEETGAHVAELHFIGEYCVHVPEKPFLKAVFFARVTDIEKKEDYLETDGPYNETGDLLHVRFQESYSFLMKDDVIACSFHELERKGLL
ncbi:MULTISPECIES: RNA deprotection pyrophosphohydrolase [Bacillaceae]|uniref:7,8-dihydro-8-oxoguanine-triphosphatase n=1 Tax=Domibacillus aminovorans TaxID=29332 RepID=A0A177LA26_9BACI|nr:MULTISPECIES: nucleoside triphosphatase YtkD [Bacillaceae]OAH56275.1 7,8-dihydro-8-oxoguanine-triphosphatase [Domibacillus aminovorans]OAH62578.1 7,8-dihydro-8-oxoguanine-triphosphatase [Domibacillus aminovorans]